MQINREVLENEVERGKTKRQKYEDLKGGKGTVFIYKDNVKHPDPRTHEAGKILLKKDSTIGDHVHDKDFEVITVLAGLVEINGEVYPPGTTFTCEKGAGHNVRNLADGISILRYVKKKE